MKKIIRFTQITNNVFNLGFGDLDETSGEISDISVTNNNDSRKVLATDKKSSSKKTLAVIDPKVGNFEKHPFFIKKLMKLKLY